MRSVGHPLRKREVVPAALQLGAVLSLFPVGPFGCGGATRIGIQLASSGLLSAVFVGRRLKVRSLFPACSSQWPLAPISPPLR